MVSTETLAMYEIENTNILSPKIIEKLCRLCLEEKQTMWSFFSVLTFDDGSSIDVVNIFHSLTGEDREKMENPKLPPYICEHCLDLLSSAYTFQQKYKESMDILNKYLNEKSDLEDISKDMEMVIHSQQNTIVNNYEQETDGLQDNKESKLHIFKYLPTWEVSSSDITTSPETANKINHSLTAFEEKTSAKMDERHSKSTVTKRKTINLVVAEDSPIYSKTSRTEVKLHRCPICPKELTALELKKHCKSHKSLKTYLKSAPKYNKKVRFYATPRTENNGLFNQDKIFHACPFCQEQFESEPFKDHIKQHRIEGNFRCNVCNRIFLGINHLKTHQLSHKKEAPFKCNFCKKAFFLKTNYDCHLLKHFNTKELPFKCNYCNKTFSNPQHLKRHKFGHENEVNYHTFYKREMSYVKCNQCQQKFRTKDDKDLHSCKLFCAKCRKLFESKSKFKSHVCKNRLKISQCLPCGKVFQLPSSIKSHKFRCTRRTLCYVCGKNVSNITAHLLTHYPNKRAPSLYKCASCNKQFSCRGSLMRHFSDVHLNIVRFQCQYCSKGFKGKWNLQVHERIHHGIRNYVCNICNKAFLENSYLKKHMKTHSRHEVQ